MSRIEPIRRTHALVARERRRVHDDRPKGWDGSERRRQHRRPPVQGRTGLGAATEHAAYEIHRLTSGFSAGLRADLALRGVWASTYAAKLAEPPAAPTLRKIT